MTGLMCPLCEQPNFSNVNSLRLKLISVATQNIACPICPEILLGLDKFTIHLFGHCQPEPESTINIADFDLLTCLDGPKNCREDLSKPVDNKCNLELKDSSLLAIHQKLIHSIDKQENDQFECLICKKHFKMRNSLIVHFRVAHARGISDPEERTFQCNLCPKSFKKDQYLGQHLKTHEGKQWQCETCGKYFTTKYFLRKHQRLHTGEMPYQCEICKKTFTFQQSYHKHLLYHSADKPHECQQCGRAFKELSTLQNHQRIHSGEKPFACSTCGKCFRQRVSFIVHQRIHTGVLPYQCTACKKKFRYKISQRSHKCTTHPPGVVVRQPTDLIERLLQQKSDLNSQQQKLPEDDFIEKLMEIRMESNNESNINFNDSLLSVYNI